MSVAMKLLKINSTHNGLQWTPTKTCRQGKDTEPFSSQYIISEASAWAISQLCQSMDGDQDGNIDDNEDMDWDREREEADAY